MKDILRGENKNSGKKNEKDSLIISFSLSVFRLVCSSSVLQVSTKRTFSCPPALLCPAGGALATVQPVKSRSSAALAASRDQASRRLSDQREDALLLLILLLFLSSPPTLILPFHLPGLTLRSNFSLIYFFLCRRARTDSVEEEYFKTFLCCSRFGSFVGKETLSIGGLVPRPDSTKRI